MYCHVRVSFKLGLGRDRDTLGWHDEVMEVPRKWLSNSRFTSRNKFRQAKTGNGGTGQNRTVTRKGEINC